MLCRKCKKDKPIKRFKVEVAFNVRRRTCKDCRNAMHYKRLRENPRLLNSQKKAGNKWRRRHGHTREIQTRYGLSKKQYNTLVRNQKGRCAFCNKPPRKGARAGKLSVDHNHKTGKVRGLLCVLCNTMLGRFNEDIKKFQNVIRYLRKGN